MSGSGHILASTEALLAPQVGHERFSPDRIARFNVAISAFLLFPLVLWLFWLGRGKSVLRRR